MTEIATQTTLQEAKDFLRKNWEEGTTCPCCRQHVQIYARPITSAMAFGLILFYKHWKKNPNETWTHMETMLKEADCPPSIRGDMSKLKYWGLLLVNEECEGYYKISGKGADFVLGRIKVESHVKLYNNRNYGFKGNYVDIFWCLKKKFDYTKLMEGTL